MFGVTSGIMRSGASLLPLVLADFTTLNAYSMPSWIDYSGILGGRMMVDNTGKLVWAPANLLLNSASLATQTVTGGVAINGNYILSFKGTGSVAISGGYSGTLTGTSDNNRVSLKFSSTTASLTFTVTGTVTEAQLERVTYQTSPSTYSPTTSAAVYLPRFVYDFTTLLPQGLLIEDSRTNIVRWSNDLTNAAWVISNTTDITAALNEIGVDGVANGATSLLCNNANGTILQSNTLASSARFQTAYVKRLVGTGTISMTMDGGTTWVNVTSQISEAWARISIPSQTVTNPQVGFRMGTVGDKIAVQYFQNENGGFATSPIFTTSASMTRVADNIKLSGSALTTAGAAEGSIITETGRLPSAAATAFIVATSSTRARLYYAGTYTTNVGTRNSTTILSGVIGNSGDWSTGIVRTALGWAATGNPTNLRSVVANNGTVVGDTSAAGTETILYLGSWAGSLSLNSTIRSMAIYNTRLSDATLKQKSTVGAVY